MNRVPDVCCEHLEERGLGESRSRVGADGARDVPEARTGWSGLGGG